MTENAKWLMGCSTPRGLMQSTSITQITEYCNDDDLVEIAKYIGKGIDKKCNEAFQQLVLLDDLCLIHKCWSCLRFSSPKYATIQKIYDNYSHIVMDYIKHH